MEKLIKNYSLSNRKTNQLHKKDTRKIKIYLFSRFILKLTIKIRIQMLQFVYCRD